MRAAIETDVLSALMNSTPEQYAALRRILGLPLISEPLCASAAVSSEVAERNRTLEIVSEIHKEITAIREERRTLKSAKERLEQLQTEKLFAFTSKIDTESFRIFCAVLAHGDIAKASRALNMPDNTLRSRVERWAERGPAYQTLTDLLRWRKTMGNRGTLELHESITRGTTAPTDFAGLLSDVLDELLAMNEDNWNEKVEDLADLLRPHVER